MKEKKIPDFRDYVKKDFAVKHQDYSIEKQVYELILEGREQELKDRLTTMSMPEDNKLKGVLSDDPLRDAQYHFAIFTANVARQCIGSGMPQEQAFRFSDMYIRKADKCADLSAVYQLGIKMALEYCSEMKLINDRPKLSLAVRKAEEFICDNLHKQIVAEEVAAYTGYNRSYLSLIFKKETGLTMQDYITNKRVETAKTMLRLTDYSYTDIASALAFSTHSYFCRKFKEIAGVTPKTYRLENSEV